MATPGSAKLNQARVYIALENIRSLENVGAIFRTCSFFGFYNVLLVGYSGKFVRPNGFVELHEKVKKVSLGSENDLNIILVGDSYDLIKYSEDYDLDLIAIEQHPDATKIANWTPKSNSILVFGNEVEGVSPLVLEKAKKIVEIPKTGKHNSLNVSTSVGVVLAKLV